MTESVDDNSMDGDTLEGTFLPCSHSRTSMLGGILRALLAMCFSNVVFPLLKDEKIREHCISYYQYTGEHRATRWLLLQPVKLNFMKC